MKSRRLLTWLRPSALAMVLSFAIGALIISQPLLTPPAAAKGFVNTRNDDDSNKSNDQPKPEEKKPDPPKAEPPKPEPPKPDPPRYEAPKQEPQPAPQPQPQPRYEAPAPAPTPQPEPPKQVVQPTPPPVTQPSQPVVAQPSPAPQPQYPTPAPQPTEERHSGKSGMRNSSEERRNDSSHNVVQPSPNIVHDPVVTPDPKPEKRRPTEPQPSKSYDKPEQRSVEATPERRGTGPGSIGDKIEDRHERRDRDDRRHRNRSDWYESPTVVIYEPIPVPIPVPVPSPPDTGAETAPIPTVAPTPGQEPPLVGHQGDAKPEPGSIDEALQDIQAAWLEKDPEFLAWHVDRGDTVDIYIDHKFSHTLKAEEFLSLTRDAIDGMKTYEFRYVKTRKSDLSARAMAEHVYRDLDQGVDKSIRLTYFLEKIRAKWLIKRIDVQKGEAYGSPDSAKPAGPSVTMTKEVMIMRRFRDPDLLAKKPGAMFVTEYRRADPSVLDAATGDSTVVATIVRLASDQAFKADLPSEDNW